jgi:hypothetical protein
MQFFAFARSAFAMAAFDASALAARPMNNRAFIRFSWVSIWVIVAGLHYHMTHTDLLTVTGFNNILPQRSFHAVDRSHCGP